MSILLFSCLDMDAENVNRAFEDVLAWMEDLNMKEESDAFADEFIDVVAKDNPFNIYANNRMFTSPEYKMIALIYETATEWIKRKYPNAVTTYKVSGYNSTFKVDDETYDKAYRERREAE